MWLVTDLQLEKNWSAVQAKVGTLVCVYIFHLILYWLSILPFSDGRLKALESLLFLWGVVVVAQANGPQIGLYPESVSWECYTW